MTPLMLAACLAAQFPSPQAPAYGVPSPQSIAVSIPAYSAPQVVVLGSGQVAQPGPFGLLLGHIGRKLEKHSWPRVQPATAAVPAMAAQVVYLSVQQQPVQQACYVMPPQATGSPPYGVGPIPPYGSKQAPGSPPSVGPPPQQPQQPAARHDESVPPVPPR